MGTAALVLGIITVILGFIPLVGVLAFIPAVVGLILGIVDVIQKSKKDEKKGTAVAGIILNGIAILIIGFWVAFFGLLANNLGEYVFDNQNIIQEYVEDAMNSIEGSTMDTYNGFYGNKYENI